MKLTAVFLLLTILTSGCVFQPPTTQQIAAAPFSAATEPEIICRKEKPTGSNRKVTVCREVLSADDQEQTRQTMKRLQRQSEGAIRN